MIDFPETKSKVRPKKKFARAGAVVGTATCVATSTEGDCSHMRMWRRLAGWYATVMGKTRKSFYAVRTGRKVGVYNSW